MNDGELLCTYRTEYLPMNMGLNVVLMLGIIAANRRKSMFKKYIRIGLILIINSLAANVQAHSTKLTDAADIHFSHNNANLQQTGKEKLIHLVSKLERHALEVVIAIGHAGDQEKDVEALSSKRADVVKRFLMTLGIPPVMIYTEGQGKKRLAVEPQMTKFQLQDLNARVEVEAVGTHGGGHTAALGFSASHLWFDEVAKQELRTMEFKDSFSETHPLVFLRSIEDEKLREKFVHQLMLSAIERQAMHELAIYSAEAINCSRIDADFPNTYQYAVVRNRQNALASIQHCQPQVSESNQVQSYLKIILNIYCQIDNYSKPQEPIELQRIFEKTIKLARKDVSNTVFERCVMTSKSMTQWLVGNGVAVDQKLSFGLTAIQAAMNAVRYDIVQTLLELGANPNIAIEATGETLLHRVNQAKSCFPQVACHLPHVSRRKQIWNLLIQHGANPNLADKLGRLPTPP